MEHLYYLHPIFEFYLTVYFGFIVAPEFLGRFLIEEFNFEKNKVELIDTLAGYLKKITDADKEIITKGFGSETTTNVSTSFRAAAKGLEDIINKINEAATKVENEKKFNEPLKVELSKKLRGCYDKVFPFALLYSFFILLLSGILGHKGSDSSYPSLLIFMLLSFIYMLLLIFRKIIRKRFPDMIPYSSFYSVIVMVLIFLMSFIFIPVLTYDFFSNYYIQLIIILSTVAIGVFPMVVFTIELLQQRKKNYFRIKFEKEISDAINDADTVLLDYDDLNKSSNKFKKKK